MPGDRGGGRESKGSSLKLKNPGVEKKNKKVAKADTGLPTATAPPPPLGEGANLDCGVALISRQFDRDRDRVIQRSRDEGDVCAMLLWSSDWEKQEAVAKLCADRRGQVGPGHMAAQRITRRRARCNGNRPAGWKVACADHAQSYGLRPAAWRTDGRCLQCYCMLGVHPDNIGKDAKRNQDPWLATAGAHAGQRNVQHATCNMQHATCNDNVQRTTASAQRPAAPTGHQRDAPRPHAAWEGAAFAHHG